MEVYFCCCYCCLRVFGLVDVTVGLFCAGFFLLLHYKLVIILIFYLHYRVLYKTQKPLILPKQRTVPNLLQPNPIPHGHKNRLQQLHSLLGQPNPIPLPLVPNNIELRDVLIILRVEGLPCRQHHVQCHAQAP